MSAPDPTLSPGRAVVATEFPALLQADQLTLRYGDKTALHAVSLSAGRGRITALIGPSGCGKTSLLNCFNRLTDLIPGCRVTGIVHCGDIDIYHPRTDVMALRRRVGMIFQKPNPFPFSIRRNLDFPLREHGFRDRRVREEKIEMGLRDVGLWDEVKDRLDRPALALSGGQQQRLCLARALVLSPEVLLLDEPCSALDPISAGAVEELIRTLRGKLTLLMVTHNLAQARRLADEVGLLWAQDGSGTLVEFGPVQQIFEQPLQQRTANYVKGVP